jgi:hypothetical protein
MARECVRKEGHARPVETRDMAGTITFFEGAGLVTDRRLADQWTSRDRPVLIEAVRRFEEDDDQMVSVGEIDATGLIEGHVVRAGRRLSRAGSVDAMGVDEPPILYVTAIGAEALRITGPWPDAGDAFDRRLRFLETRIAEAPPEETSRLTKVREDVVGPGRDLGVEVLGAAITGRRPL